MEADMSMRIESQFKIESWDENEFSAAEDGPKLNRASVTQSYYGGMEGESRIEYLTMTLEDESAIFIGYEHFHGSIKGRSGSLVFKHEGTHRDGVAKSQFQIVPDSGTGGLKGINGDGTFEATHEKALMELKYDFE